MRTTIEMEEATSDGYSALGFARLLVIPAIALTLMLTLTLSSAAQPSTRAQTGLSEPSRRHVDEAYTLYIYAGQSAMLEALNEAELVRSLHAGKPTPDWYARVETPAEEAQVMKAWLEANWIRSDLGLSQIRLVDLRRP